MELSNLDRFLWMAGFAGHLLLLGVLAWRGRFSKFPLFSALIAFSPLRTILLYYAQRSGGERYFYLYWQLTTVDTLLQFLAFAECAWKIFRPLGHFSRDVRRPLALIVVVSIGLAALSAPPVESADQAFVLRFGLFSTLLMAQIFAGLTLLSAQSAFSWSSQVGVIARGLGFFSVLSLAVQGLQNYLGTADGGRAFHMLSYFQIFGYFGCLSYWTFGLGKRMPETRVLSPEMKLQLHRVDAYLGSVLATLRFGGSPS